MRDYFCVMKIIKKKNYAMKLIHIITLTIASSLILLAGCRKSDNNPPIPDLADVVPGNCTTPPLRLWLFSQFVTWGQELTLISASPELHMPDMANFYALHYENSGENQYFGANAEHTDKINSVYKDLKRFWKYNNKNVFVVGSHGSMMQDREKVFKMYKTVFNYPDDKANRYADSIGTLLKTYPQFLKGDHPAFSFNQLAIPDTTIANVGRIPAKIIIGDGLLKGFDELGFKDVAPQAILAHELGHHLQYELGILKTGMKLVPKTSRRIELMADAYAAYFLAHPQGAGMSLTNLQQVAEVFFNTGDCDFAVDSHHGTPAQRKAATEWGYKMATVTGKQTPILPAEDLAKLFDAELSNIVK